jgi:hypothetical protein
MDAQRQLFVQREVALAGERINREIGDHICVSVASSGKRGTGKSVSPCHPPIVISGWYVRVESLFFLKKISFSLGEFAGNEPLHCILVTTLRSAN